MGHEDLLCLDQAAQESGLPRPVVRELLRCGRLPAVRRKGRWRIARSELARIVPEAEEVTTDCDGQTPCHIAQPFGGRVAGHAVLALLREREHELRRLREERSRLVGLVGSLRAQVMDRDARIATLEAPISAAISSCDDPATAQFVSMTARSFPEPGPTSSHVTNTIVEDRAPTSPAVSRVERAEPTASSAAQASRARGPRRLLPAVFRLLGRNCTSAR